MDLKELYQELIIDHGTHPRNCCILNNATETAEGFNPLCGDKVQIFLLIDENTIKKASFIGSGCAICMASTSLMIEALTGNTTEHALAVSKSFRSLLLGIKGSSNDSLGKLDALLGVRSFPTRIKCATLAWHTLEAAMHNRTETITTEE
jgi:nitrogen fixation protein NifU and related proteins